MSRTSHQHKRDDDYHINPLHDMTGSTQASAMEEARLLRRDDLDLEDSIPPPHHARHRSEGLWNLLRGPEPARTQVIQPFFPSLQRAPVRLLETSGYNKKILLIATLSLWLFIFTLFLSSQLPIRDGDGNHVINLDCVDTLWRRKNECGTAGIDCRPFKNDSFAFRCPANCGAVRVLNPYAVGPVEVNYRPLVIGAEKYRADSFVCASAIHAGVINDQKGGCGRVTLLGDNENFASTTHHGIESIAFDSYFPKSFSISPENSFRCPSDPRSALLPFSLITTFALAVFTASPKIFFFIFTLIFAHVSLVSDPPMASHRNVTVLPDHLSMFVKRLLPAYFIAIILYRAIVERTLSKLTAPVEKSLLWLGGFWIGALSNYSFDWIPISRLTAHDLKQQPGAKLALAIIILLLVAIIAGQIYSFWLEGRLPRYLRLYGIFIAAILASLIIPGVSLRLHHYILALLLLPGTSIQSRPSLLYQGILLGLFVNGIARWDFDSVLQTSSALRGDAKFESIVPHILAPVINVSTGTLTATFAYGTPPSGIDGISILINDVEYDRAFYHDGSMGERSAFDWARPAHTDSDRYFRFAYVKNGRTLDYSKAGTLFGNGTWNPPNR